MTFAKQPKHFCFDHKRDIVLHMFPKELHFNIHPRELQQAVELLPEPKGYVRHSESASTELKNKLLQVPVEKLRLWKMKPKMLAKLPYLVIEKENKALQERVLAIAVVSMENCSEETLLQLLGYLYGKKEFIQAMNARFIKSPPKKNSWLQVYYKLFRSEMPVSTLAEFLLKEVKDITQLDSALKISMTSPLFEMVCMHYAKDYNWKRIKGLSFDAVQKFLERGFPLQVKRKLLLELLKEYCNGEYPITVLKHGSAMRELAQYSIRLFGGFNNPIWRLVPKAKRLAQILSLEKTLETYLGFGDSFSRLRWWRRWIESIDEIIVHRPSSLICFYVGDVVIVESLAVAQWIYMYDRQDFMVQIQPKLWDSSPFQIDLKADVMERGQGWQDIMNRWMSAKELQKGEEW